MEINELQEWVKWANTPSTDYPGRTNILPEVISYICENHEYFTFQQFYECWKNHEIEWEYAGYALSPSSCSNFSKMFYEHFQDAKSLSDCNLQTHEEIIDLLMQQSMNESSAVDFLLSVYDTQMVIVDRGTEKVLLKCSKKIEGEISIPEGITELGDDSFSYCRNLIKVRVPNTVKRIGRSCFCGCEQLNEVTLPEGINAIERETFGGCCMKSIKLPNSLERIEDMAFIYCRELMRIVIPKNVKSIGGEAFQKCESLKEVIIESDSLVLNMSAFVSLVLDSIETRCSVQYKKFGVSYNYHYPSISKLIIRGTCDTIDLDKLSPCDYTEIDFVDGCPNLIKNLNTSNLYRLKVNVPRNNISDEQYRMLKAACHKDRQNDVELTFAAPTLCESQSIIPGYFKVTEAYNLDYRGCDHDVISDINTKYVLKTEPIIINRYEAVNGCLITLASDSRETQLHIRVYESKEIVDNKIKTALESLSTSIGGVAGLLNELNRLFDQRGR